MQNFGCNSLANYEKKEIIGRGAYGEVYKAIDKRTKAIVALKKVLLEMESEGFPSNSLREISILRETQQNKNIISLYDVIIDQKRLYLVFEYGEQDLRTYLDSLGPNKFIEQATVKKLMFQLLSGIADCHMKRIIHRDLKPANLLINKNGQLKIGDFGLARTFSVPVRPYSHEVVTLWYRAPEILLGSAEYSTPIDIWAIGCIFAEMITKKPLFEGQSEIDQIFRIFKTLGTPNESTWAGVTSLKHYKSKFPNFAERNVEQVFSFMNGFDPKGLDLLKRMLKYDPNVRITASNALKHPYFKDFKME